MELEIVAGAEILCGVLRRLRKKMVNGYRSKVDLRRCKVFTRGDECLQKQEKQCYEILEIY